MRRSSDGRWLNGDGAFPLDPDLKIKRIGKLMPMTSFGPDGIWQHVVFRDIPPLEILKIRRMQKIRLARYARIDYFVWDARDVLDLATCYAELVEVLNAEQDMSKASESQ